MCCIEKGEEEEEGCLCEMATKSAAAIKDEVRVCLCVCVCVCFVCEWFLCLTKGRSVLIALIQAQEWVSDAMDQK